MFGICIWYELNPKTMYQEINKYLSTKCKAQIHTPHLTAEKKLDIKKAKKNISNYVPIRFYKNGNVYQTKTTNFYSLQQNYIDSNKRLYHVSLSYKVNNPFLQCDIDYCNTLDLPNILYKKDITISLWNCDNVYTKYWYKICL